MSALLDELKRVRLALLEPVRDRTLQRHRQRQSRGIQRPLLVAAIGVIRHERDHHLPAVALTGLRLAAALDLCGDHSLPLLTGWVGCAGGYVGGPRAASPAG